HDWADAKARLGREPRLHELGRTPGQRRADALVEMAVRSASTPPHAKRPRPLFTLVIGAERFFHLSQLAPGRTTPPAAVTPWIDNADLQAMLFEPDGLRAIKVS